MYKINVKSIRRHCLQALLYLYTITVIDCIDCTRDSIKISLLICRVRSIRLSHRCLPRSNSYYYYLLILSYIWISCYTVPCSGATYNNIKYLCNIQYIDCVCKLNWKWLEYISVWKSPVDGIFRYRRSRRKSYRKDLFSLLIFFNSSQRPLFNFAIFWVKKERTHTNFNIKLKKFNDMTSM